MPDGTDWWKIILGLVLLIILLMIISPLLPVIIRVVFWILSLPFKLIKAIFKPRKRRNK